MIRFNFFAGNFTAGTTRAAGAIAAAFTFVFYGVPYRKKRQYQYNCENTII